MEPGPIDYSSVKPWHEENHDIVIKSMEKLQFPEPETKEIFPIQVTSNLQGPFGGRTMSISNSIQPLTMSVIEFDPYMQNQNQSMKGYY